MEFMIPAKNTYPNDYCGSCPIWLAAFTDEHLATYDDVVAECERRKCALVNQEHDDTDTKGFEYGPT